jgi:capsular polysaccharide biosynthesis protein
MKRWLRLFYARINTLYMKSLSDQPIFPVFRKACPSLYFHARDFRSQILTRWYWWRANHRRDVVFLPALRGLAFTTRSYFSRIDKARRNESPKYIPVIKAARFMPPAPKNLGDDELSARLRIDNPSLFVAQLCDASVFGEHGDVITKDGILLADISYWNPSDIWLWNGKHKLIESNPLPEQKKLNGTYMLLTTSSAGINYFHWMFNLLPRISLLERAGVRIENIDGFLVNRMEILDVQRTMLQAVGIQPDHVIETDKNDAYQIGKLWVTSNLHSSGHRSRWSCDWLREKFISFSPPEKPTRRLYISREDASSRHIANEEEVLALLTLLGFEKVVIGKRSVFEQSALFASADVIVGVHGAGLANIVFCTPGTRIIDVIPVNWYPLYYLELSACMALNYYYVIADVHSFSRNRWEGDLILKLDRLVKILHTAGIT